MKLLFVCTGNTCRSPLAESIARELVIRRGWIDVEVESAGTGAASGAPASDGSYLVGLEHGLDLGGHTARQLTPELIAGADLILTMGPAHLAVVNQMGGSTKAELLSVFAQPSSEPRGVADPFGGDLDTYRATFDELATLLQAAFVRLEGVRSGREG